MPDDREVHAEMVKRMRRVLFEKDMTYRELAELMQMDKSAISRRMQGVSFFSAPEVVRFCAVTGSDVSNICEIAP